MAISTVQRTFPRVSLNKIAEYLSATPARRKAIIKDQKKPITFKAARYKNAYDAIIQFMTSGMTDTDILNDKVFELTLPSQCTDWAQNDKDLSAEIINKFINIKDQIELDDYSPEPCDRFEDTYFHVAGVNISVRPDILLHSAEHGGNPKYGGIKFSFVKSYPMKQIGCEYAASILYQYLKNNLTNVDHKKCICIDVASGLIASAPRSYRRTMHEVETACEEIAARWASL